MKVRWSLFTARGLKTRNKKLWSTRPTKSYTVYGAVARMLTQLMEIHITIIPVIVDI